MYKTIDFRSDTVTKPTQRMRDAMYKAEIGDDVLGEDPTVQQLEQMAAERFGKEAALFVVSGTMANQVAVLTLCRPGDQIIVHDRSHIYNLEVGGLAATCGVQPRALPASNGQFDLSHLAEEIHPADIQRSPTTLICLENTFDLNRGLLVYPESIHAICEIAHTCGMHTYLDGARIFNAAVAIGCSVADLSTDVDAVSTCLSKGLACPVGSLLMGSKDFIEAARRMRQRLGGGWRQAGILAAAGIVALEEMVDRLVEDHIHARRLADALFPLGFDIDMQQVQTNIIHVGLHKLGMYALPFDSRLQEYGIKIKVIGQTEFRMVTHKDISEFDIDFTIDAMQELLENSRLVNVEKNLNS